MENGLIIVKQLPVIEDQLAAVKESITKRVNEALSLVCNEETYKDVKKVRAELNKEYAELEARRKEVKAAVLAPYERFEKVYKDCAGDLYVDADRKLKIKISEVESGLKSQKETGLAEYFTELRESLGLTEEIVRLEDAKIKVGMADSLTGLKKKARDFLEKVCADREAMSTMDDADEILMEYRKTFDLGQAISAVTIRKKAIEEEKKRRAEVEAIRKAQQEAAERAESMAAPAAAPAAEPVAEPVAEPAAAPVPEAIQPPVVVETAEQVPPVEKIYETTFRVRGTVEMLRALKRFMEEGGYQYESV